MGSMYSGTIGSGIGAAVGGYFGGAAGAQIGSQAGGQIGDIFGKKAQLKYNENRQFESEIRNYLYTKSLIDYQNNYNSPTNQMKRLQEAGLNPMLVYGGGNVVGNQSGSGSAPSTSYSASNYDARGLDLLKYQAIDNAQLNNQLTAEHIVAQKNTNDAFDVNLELQLANAEEQNGILKARKRLEEANADIAEHDKNIIVKGKDTTSKDPAIWRKIDYIKNKLTDNRRNVIHDINFNPDGSEKPWYQFWEQDSIFGRWHKKRYGW